MNKIFLYVIPFIISSIITFVAHNNELWTLFWKFFTVSLQIPPFSDLDSISKAVDLKQAGFNPYLENQMNFRYIYPSIWLKFFEFFDLNNLRNFRIFIFFILYIYTFIYLDLIFKFKNNFFSIILLILFFSSANLLALERLNIEIIIFILIYFLAISKSYLLRIPIFILAIYCKIYPLFTVFIFLRNKFIFFTMVFISLLILFHMRHEILFLMQYGNEVALNIAYGVPTLVKGMWYYSMKLGYVINDDNYKYFKYSMIFLASIYAGIIILINFKFGEKKISNNFDLEEKLFICGAGIFIGRFISFSNFDYALIFLIFTIPFILKIEAQKIKIILISCLILIFYSDFLEFGNRYTFSYLFRAIFIHTFKIIVFSFMCFYFGKVLNKHLKI